MQLIEAFKADCLDAVSTRVCVGCVVERLMNVSEEVDEKAQFSIRIEGLDWSELAVEWFGGQVLDDLSDQRIDTACIASFAHMARAFKQSDVDEMPWCRDSLSAGHVVAIFARASSTPSSGG